MAVTPEELKNLRSRLINEEVYAAADEAIEKAIGENATLTRLARAVMSKSAGEVIRNAVELHVEGLEDKAKGIFNKTVIELDKLNSVTRAEIKDKIDDAVNELLAQLGVTRTIHFAELDTDIDVTSHHMAMSDLILSAHLRDDAMLVGAAGSGKGHASRSLAEMLGLKYYAVSCSPFDQPFKFEGGMDANGHFHRPSFRQAYEHGGVILIDEIDALNPRCGVVLNAAFSDGMYNFPDKLVDRHPDLVVVCAANTYGRGADMKYVGRNALDAATLDRFSFIEWDYDESLEMRLSPITMWTKFLHDVRKWVFDKKKPYIISMRANLQGAKLLMAGDPFANVLKKRVFKGWNIDDVEACMSSLFDSEKKKQEFIDALMQAAEKARQDAKEKQKGEGDGKDNSGDNSSKGKGKGQRGKGEAEGDGDGENSGERGEGGNDNDAKGDGEGDGQGNNNQGDGDANPSGSQGGDDQSTDKHGGRGRGHGRPDDMASPSEMSGAHDDMAEALKEVAEALR